MHAPPHDPKYDDDDDDNQWHRIKRNLEKCLNGILLC